MQTTTQSLQQQNQAELSRLLQRNDRRAGTQADWKKTAISNRGPDEMIRETTPELCDPQGREIRPHTENGRGETESGIQNMYARFAAAAARPALPA